MGSLMFEPMKSGLRRGILVGTGLHFVLQAIAGEKGFLPIAAAIIGALVILYYLLPIINTIVKQMFLTMIFYTVFLALSTWITLQTINQGHFILIKLAYVVLYIIIYTAYEHVESLNFFTVTQSWGKPLNWPIPLSIGILIYDLYRPVLMGDLLLWLTALIVLAMFFQHKWIKDEKKQNQKLGICYRFLHYKSDNPPQSFCVADYAVQLSLQDKRILLTVKNSSRSDCQTYEIRDGQFFKGSKPCGRTIFIWMKNYAFQVQIVHRMITRTLRAEFSTQVSAFPRSEDTDKVLKDLEQKSASRQ